MTCSLEACHQLFKFYSKFAQLKFSQYEYRNSAKSYERHKTLETKSRYFLSYVLGGSVYQVPT